VTGPAVVDEDLKHVVAAIAPRCNGTLRTSDRMAMDRTRIACGVHSFDSGPDLGFPLLRNLRRIDGQNVEADEGMLSSFSL
jgi:hypothetical protein